MNKRRQRYCKLRTMAELQHERARLSKMMKANETDLGEDWDEIKYWLTPANLLDEVMSRVYLSSPVIRNIVAGARAAVSMIRSRMAR